MDEKEKLLMRIEKFRASYDVLPTDFLAQLKKFQTLVEIANSEELAILQELWQEIDDQLAKNNPNQ